jgi:Na+/proline symporter
MFLAYVGVFMDGALGHRLQPQIFGGSISGMAIFLGCLWKWRRKRGWIGALIGAFAGIVVIFAAIALSNYEFVHQIHDPFE